MPLFNIFLNACINHVFQVIFFRIFCVVFFAHHLFAALQQILLCASDILGKNKSGAESRTRTGTGYKPEGF